MSQQGSDTGSAIFAPLSRAGWIVELASATNDATRASLAVRYDWVPVDVLRAVRSAKLVVARDQLCWLFTEHDYLGLSDSAYPPSFCEELSADAAVGDPRWMAEIRQFWDRHFPVGASVRDGYAYLALVREDLHIVMGREPEFEEVVPFASSYAEMVARLSQGCPF